MSACQKHGKNSLVTSQYKETRVARNKLKSTARNILFCLFSSLCVTPWRECYPFVGIDRRFALSHTVACRYFKCSVFHRRAFVFPCRRAARSQALLFLSQTVHLLVTLVVIGEPLLLQSTWTRLRNWSCGSRSHNRLLDGYSSRRQEMIGEWKWNWIGTSSTLGSKLHLSCELFMWSL